MTATLATLKTEFDKLIPALEADYIAFVTNQLERLLKTYDDTALRNLANSWHQDGYIYRNLRRFLCNVEQQRAIANGEADTRFTYGASYRKILNGIDHAHVAKEATAYARDQVDSFIFKLTRKFGDLTNVTVHFADTNALECTITGEQAGHKVYIQQDRIINTSKNGKPFHQWPARLTVDGKRVSEAAWKKLVA